ncbi:MAG: sensor histidine kinase, partial [Myxococcota bacterium]
SLITTEIREATGALAVVLSRFEPDGDLFRLTHIAAGDEPLSNVTPILGSDIHGLAFSATPHLKERLLNNQINVSGDIHELSHGVIPRAVSDVLQERFNLGMLAGLLLNYGGDILGTLIIAMNRQGALPSDEGLKLYSNLCSVALKRRYAEEALLKSHAEAQNLSQRIEHIREEERARIARELHDELGQALTALKIDISYAAGRVGGCDPSVAARLGSALAITGDQLSAVKRISAELRPGILDDLGLSAAIEWQAGEFSKRTGIECRLLLPPGDMVLDGPRTTALFRIAQEALTNIARHSGATRAGLMLSRKGAAITLEVTDNGSGISEAHVKDPHSLGLAGMRERVRQLGGDFEISGRRGKGTRLKVSLPSGENP